MSATLTAPRPTDTIPEDVPSVVSPPDHAPEAVAEEHRWLLLLTTPFLLGAAFFALAVGTGQLWLMGPAMVLGPGALIAMFVYLGLSSEANSVT